MQINSINPSIKFKATIGPKLKETIDRSYSSLEKVFCKEYKDVIKKITDATENNDIIDIERSGDIYIVGKGTGWHKRMLTQAKFNGMFFIDDTVADEIVKNAKEQ